MVKGDRKDDALLNSDEEKPLLIFINPKSGTGHSQTLFEQHLEPLLKLHKIKYELVTTKHAGHARELVLSAPDLSAWKAIIGISGDGLVNEVYTGLYQRYFEWKRNNNKSKNNKSKNPLETPIGLMPGGSGCALNCSLLRYLGQPLDGLNNLGPSASARNVALGASANKTTPLDFIEVDLENGERHVSFLGVTFGVIADGDIGTEWMRCVGFLRVYLYIGFRTLFPAPYTVKVSYLPLDRDESGKVIPVKSTDPPIQLPPLGTDLPTDQGWVTETNTYHVVYGLNLSMLDPMTLFAPESSPGDGALWVVLVRGQITRLELINWFMALPEGPDFSGNPTGLACFPVKAFRFEPVDPPAPKSPTEPAPGILSMDAESVHFGSVQGKILPQAGRLLVGEDK